jgi:hypothetical protein
MWLAAAIGFWILAIAGHAVLCRLRLPFGAVGHFLLAGLVSGAGLAWLACRHYGAWTPATVSALVAFAFLCELYLFLFTLAIASVSSTLLQTLGDRRLSEKEVIARYDAEGMVTTRIGRLLATGLLSESEGDLRVTRTGARLVTAFLRLKTFFGHPIAVDDHLGADCGRA